MCVGTESDGGWIRQSNVLRNMFLRGRDDFSEDVVPLMVKQSRRIAPRILLGLKRHIRPWMMAMRGDVQRRARPANA